MAGGLGISNLAIHLRMEATWHLSARAVAAMLPPQQERVAEMRDIRYWSTKSSNPPGVVRGLTAAPFGTNICRSLSALECVLCRHRSSVGSMHAYTYCRSLGLCSKLCRKFQ